jgi:hypothetical protein
MPLHRSPSRRPPDPRAGFGPCLLLAFALLGCAPELDWREVRPAGQAVQALFPCKPVAQERRVLLAGQPVPLTLHACASGGQTWGLASADLGDPALVARALTELAAAAALNIGAKASDRAPLQVPGATPHAASQLTTLQGTLPDGKRVQMQLALFSHGTRVYQATVLGEQVPPEAAQTFLGALRIAP